MKIAQCGILASVAAPILAVLIACQNPVVQLKSADSTGSAADQGVVSIRIQPISPIVLDAFSKNAGLSGKSPTSSRAFLAAGKVWIKLTSQQGSVEWTENHDPTVTIDPTGKTPPPVVASRTVPAGTYSLQLAVYNNAADVTPTLSGVAGDVVATTGQTNDVTVTCIPYGAIPLQLGVASDPLELAVPWEGTVDANGIATSLTAGSEQWYEIDIADTTPKRITVQTTAGSQANLFALVWDPLGTYVGESDMGSTAVVDLVPAAPGTYYISVIDAALDGVIANGPFTVRVTDLDPIIGNWTLSTVDGVPAADQGMCENLVYRSDSTASVVMVMPNNGGGVYVMKGSGTWSNDGAGTYSGTATGDWFSGTMTSTGTMSSDGQTITAQWTSSTGTATYVMVRGSVVLPPTGLAATDVTDPSGAVPAIELQWSKSVSPDVTGYEVYRGAAAGSESELVTTAESSTTSWTDSGSAIQLGAPYYYVVYAVAGSEKSPIPSNETYATPGNSGNLNVAIQ